MEVLTHGWNSFCGRVYIVILCRFNNDDRFLQDRILWSKFIHIENLVKFYPDYPVFRGLSDLLPSFPST